MVQRQFDSMLSGPIDPQHIRYFQSQFGRNIIKETFTLNEFYELIQVKPILGQHLLNILVSQRVIESKQIPGESVLRILCLLWMSQRPLKAYIFFRLISGNKRNSLTTDDIRKFYRDYLKEVNIQHDTETRERIVDNFLRGLKFDEFGDQELNFIQFYNILQEHPQAIESLYLISTPNQDILDEEENSRLYRMWMYVRNNKHRIIFLLLYILLTIGLVIFVIIFQVDHKKNHNGWKVTARIGGLLINFNFALTITLMLKETFTIIRRLPRLRNFIPIDDHIDAHRIVGSILSFWTILHIFGHVVNYATHTTEHTWLKLMFTTAAGDGWVHHSAPITGDIVFLLLLIMIICSLQCIRKRPGCFPIFRHTHKIFWLLWILLVIHARDFWKWTVGPMGLFVLEKIYGWKMYLPSYGKTSLSEVIIEDENVIVLIIRRPNNFDYRTGDYVEICIPDIAFNEWHPFTLTSSPKQKDTIRIHMMKKQNWTRKVYEHFNEMSEILQTNSEPLQIAVTSNEQELPRHPVKQRKIAFNDDQASAVIRIRGPFSSSTSFMFDDCHHAVLIGGGIGITPYISVLETLMHDIRSEVCTCKNCGHANHHDTVFNQPKLIKIDFIWVNRDVKNFGWFIKLLEDFEAEQERYLREGHQRSRLLDIHLYFTALPSREQGMMTMAPYDIIANVYASVCHEDMHTALKTVKTKVGRPPWKLLFAQFKAVQQPGQNTKVFFTGNATMGAEVKRYCDEQGFGFYHEPYY